MLFLSAALSAPLVVVRPGTDALPYSLRMNGDAIDAWSFSYHYDPLVNDALRGRVVGRRIAFLSALGTGAVSVMGGTIWHVARQEELTVGPTAMIGGGAALIVGAIPIAAYERNRTLRPWRHWTEEEARLLASRTPITHGLSIVPTASGWAVINRLGRPLSATEVAARIGDRKVLRRARARATTTNLSSTFLIGGGFAALVGGLDIASGSKLQITEDTRWTGVASAIAGTGLMVTGVIARSAQKRRQPQHFWERDELQKLLDIP